MPAAIILYAEFLLNLRQVSLYADLWCGGGEESKVEVYSDRKSILVKYDGDTSQIVYPSGIIGKATIYMPIEYRSTLSLCLEITEDGSPYGDDMEVSNNSPWPASYLGSQTEICCRCGTLLVKPIDRSWHDLPRNDWAELMDFWHCHRPSTRNVALEEPLPLRKGRIEPPILRPKIAFVDACHIFVPEEECGQILIQDNNVTCSRCSGVLGTLDHKIQGIKFLKWSILIRPNPQAAWEENKLQNFICANLLDAVDGKGCRKFLAHSDEPGHLSDGLLLWIFNPDLKYSASEVNDGQPVRAVKILFKVAGPMTLERASVTSAFEEFRLSPHMLSHLKKDLQRTNSLLPERARSLQGWLVGLLDRFDPSELSKMC